MCQTSEDLRYQAGWDGALGTSRKLLLADLSREHIRLFGLPLKYESSLLIAINMRRCHITFGNDTRAPFGQDPFPVERNASTELSLSQHCGMAVSVHGSYL